MQSSHDYLVSCLQSRIRYGTKLRQCRPQTVAGASPVTTNYGDAREKNLIPSYRCLDNELRGLEDAQSHQDDDDVLGEDRGGRE
jgi:hypothetical protein